MIEAFEVTGTEVQGNFYHFLYTLDRQNLGKQNSILMYINHFELYIS